MDCFFSLHGFFIALMEFVTSEVRLLMGVCLEGIVDPGLEVGEEGVELGYFGGFFLALWAIITCG